MPAYRSRTSTHGRSMAGARALWRATGMQEMLYPTSYLKSMGLGKACALVTDGRFSGGIPRPCRPTRISPPPPIAARCVT